MLSWPIGFSDTLLKYVRFQLLRDKAFGLKQGQQDFKRKSYYDDIKIYPQPLFITIIVDHTNYNKIFKKDLLIGKQRTT